MKVNLSVTMLLGEEGMRVELNDKDAGVPVARFQLTADQTCQLFGRLSNIPVEADVYNLDKVGKQLEFKTLKFDLPEHTLSNRKEVAIKEALRVCPEGWVPDEYFGSQDSFVHDGRGKTIASTLIRKWAKK